MAFLNSYITNVGQDLLTAAASGEKITWVRAATSSWDVDDKQASDMKALTAIVQNSSQYTGSGNVNSYIVNDNTKTASINCQIDNNTYQSGGLANLFGVWAKTDTTYPSEQLVFVARRGGGSQTSISSKSVDPEYKLFVKFGIRVDNFENPANVTLTIMDDVYATAEELNDEATAREDFDARSVTTHSASSALSGDPQDVYGEKTFKNDTKHSGNILPTESTLNIGSDTTDGRWNEIYASTFNGTEFTGNASTATNASNISYISGLTKTTKLSATNNYIISYDDIVPNAPNTYDLGSTSWQWKHIYASGENTSSGYLIIGNSENNNAYPSIRPSQNGKGWLGFSNYKFSGVCASDFYGGKFNGTLVEDTAHSIFGIIEDGSTGPFYNGTCSTASSTATKVVSCNGFSLSVGAVITVLFTNASDLSSPSLNVNSTGAKAIADGSDISTWDAGSLKTFRYTGTKWESIKVNIISNYGECTTPASTAAKVVTINNSSFKLEIGARVVVKFTNTNSTTLTNLPTLNVNSTGAKYIKMYNGTSPGSTVFDSWPANSIFELVYDGSYWSMIDSQCYAQSAKFVQVTGSTTNSQHPLVFANGVNTGTSIPAEKKLYTATSSSDVYYNPSTKTLSCKTFSGSLSGNASSATNILSSSSWPTDASAGKVIVIRDMAPVALPYNNAGNLKRFDVSSSRSLLLDGSYLRLYLSSSSTMNYSNGSIYDCVLINSSTPLAVFTKYANNDDTANCYGLPAAAYSGSSSVTRYVKLTSTTYSGLPTQSASISTSSSDQFCTIYALNDNLSNSTPTVALCWISYSASASDGYIYFAKYKSISSSTVTMDVVDRINFKSAIRTFINNPGSYIHNNSDYYESTVNYDYPLSVVQLCNSMIYVNFNFYDSSSNYVGVRGFIFTKIGTTWYLTHASILNHSISSNPFGLVNFLTVKTPPTSYSPDRKRYICLNDGLYYIYDKYSVDRTDDVSTKFFSNFYRFRSNISAS